MALSALDPDFDIEALRSRIFAPDRPRLAAAIDARVGTRNARVVWARLAERDVFPRGFAENPDREFGEVCSACWRPGDARGPTVRCAACGDALGRARSSPPSVALAVALASDPNGVAAAEALACEARARLAPWGTRALSRVVWWWLPRDWVHSLGDARAAVRPYLFDDAEGAGVVAADARSIAAENPRFAALSARAVRDWRSVRSLAWDDTARAVGWAHLAERGDVIEYGGPTGQRFADLPNPFAPVSDIWSTGYALVRVTADAIVLGVASGTR